MGTLPVNQVQDYITASLSDGTRSAYQADLRKFISWGGVVPAVPELVARYLSALAGKNKAATLQRALVAVSKAHTAQALPDPTKSDLVKAVFKGIKNKHGVGQKQATPLLKEDLVAMVSAMGYRLKDRRDAALLLIGFAGAFRRSELAALNVDDVENAQEGIVIHIRRSKTDQQGEGRKVGIPYARGHCCPVKALRDWLEVAGISEGAIFRTVTKYGTVGGQLSDYGVNRVIKERAKAIGFDPDKFSGHSLRSGLATSAAQAGVSSFKIMAQTGHRSERMLNRYVRDGKIFIDNAAGIL